MLPQTSRAGEWFLRSGIQAATGAVARYYRTDREENLPASTEITGYAASAFVYLHSLTHDQRYLDRAILAARFLAGTAWDAPSRTMPFELGEPGLSYFFDCGIIVRGLLAVWRASGEHEFLDVAAALGESMAADFHARDDIHPVLSLPDKQPLDRDSARWSRSAGCYQLKSAMAWYDLAEATGNAAFRHSYERVLESSLRTCAAFLPGHPDRHKVMDRLHAFCYFLEGLLPAVADPRCATALCTGIRSVSNHLRTIAPEFVRSDVYAQLLRVRLYSDWLGAVPLDREAADFEGRQLETFQAASADPRIDGGFYFGRDPGGWLPYVNPVSTAFALQAVALWHGAKPHRHLLI